MIWICGVIPGGVSALCKTCTGTGQRTVTQTPVSSWLVFFNLKGTGFDSLVVTGYRSTFLST